MGGEKGQTQNQWEELYITAGLETPQGGGRVEDLVQRAATATRLRVSRRKWTDAHLVESFIIKHIIQCLTCQHLK